MNITTGAEIVLNWIKRYKEQNGEYPFASEIESQLTMAIEGEKQFRQAAVSGSVLLQELIKIKDVEDEDGMPVIKVIEKANGGAISYVRYDAMVFRLNGLLKDSGKTDR